MWLQGWVVGTVLDLGIFIHALLLLQLKLCIPNQADSSLPINTSKTTTKETVDVSEAP